MNLAALTRRASAFGAAAILVAGPARAGTLWGYSGLALMPTGQVLDPGRYEVGAHAAVVDGVVLYPVSLSAGLLKGLELTLAYPGRWGFGLPVTASAVYQLVAGTPVDPTRVAIGLTNVALTPMAVPSTGTTSFVSPSNLFLVVSRDFDWPVAGRLRRLASGTLGFSGSALSWPFVNLDSRFMAGLSLPVTGALDVYGEYFGPSSQSGQYLDLGIRFWPLPFLDLDLASLGEPGLPFTERAYVLGVAFRGRWPLFASGGMALAPRPPEVPADRLAPLVPPIEPQAASSLNPPSAPVTTLYGTITGPTGAPLAGADVGLLQLGKWSQATHIGDYFVEAVPRGTYTLAIKDPRGALLATRSIAVPGDGPMQENVSVSGDGL